MPEIKLGRVPFTEAIEYFKAKDRLGTEAYTDVLHESHDRAFVIAGVTKDDVLLDVHNLLTKAMGDGTPFEVWQKEFAKTINGRWLPTTKTGEANTGWRGRVIYDTNMRTAYAAGQYKQMMEIKELKPFWRYRHGDSLKPRQEHLAWDGLVLRWDDAWWQTHYPPNGFGCSCYVEALDEIDLEDLKDRGLRESDKPDDAPPSPTRKVRHGDKEIEVPKGIDPGWAYIPGQQAEIWPAASPKGNPASVSSGGKFEPYDHPLDNKTPQDYGRPDKLKPRPEKKPVGKPASEADAIRDALKIESNRNQKVVRAKCGNWERDVLVDVNALGGHLADKDRIKHIAYLADALQPQEVWAQFMKNPAGKVVLRWKLVSFVKKEGKSVMLVCEANSHGVLEAYSFLPSDKPNYINSRIRVGRLISWE